MVGHGVEYSHAQVDTPRGFPAARDRQAAMLERMAEWVRGDTTDSELERLWQEPITKAW